MNGGANSGNMPSVWKNLRPGISLRVTAKANMKPTSVADVVERRVIRILLRAAISQREPRSTAQYSLGLG